jgi:hypothetical protein
MLILRSHRLHRTVISLMFGLVLYILLLSVPLLAQITPSGDGGWPTSRVREYNARSFLVLTEKTVRGAPFLAFFARSGEQGS